MKQVSPLSSLIKLAVVIVLLHQIGDYEGGACAFVVSTTKFLSKLHQTPRKIRFPNVVSHRILETEQISQSATIRPKEDKHEDSNDALWSYVYNLQKMRREVAQLNQVSVEQKIHFLRPAKSLALFIASNHHETVYPVDYELQSRAVIQAIRLAASLNDYKLISQIVEVVVTAAPSSDTTNHKVLEPRIIGEAVRGLSSTTASIAKIKSVWRLGSEAHCWKVPMGALEVNAMLEAYISREKIRAALDLYRQQQQDKNDSFSLDAYSLSIVLNGLTGSISDDPQPIKAIPHLENAQLTAHLSSCWQWNEALSLLDELLEHQQHDLIHQRFTNPVVSALLQLNERAHQVHKTDHNISRNALFILALLKKHGISPDTVTCTLFLSSLRTEWKVALELLHAMQKGAAATSKELWSLPTPNVYIYSAVMAVCARNQQYKEVWKLLDEIEKDPMVEPNTWIYNAVLQAVVKTAQKHSSSSPSKRSKEWMIRLGSERMKTALKLLDRMLEGKQGGSETAPDTVTYNTILTGIAAVGSYMEQKDWESMEELYPKYFDCDSSWPHAERVVHVILNVMGQHGVKRDVTTYLHSLQALKGCPVNSVSRILERAVQDFGPEIKFYNDALEVLAASGDVDGLSTILQAMKKRRVPADFDTTAHIIHALGVSGRTRVIPVLFEAIKGDKNAQRDLMEKHGVNLDVGFMLPLGAIHYSTAITSCLLSSDFESARSVLMLMQAGAFKPTQSSLEEMARAYAVVALAAASIRNGDSVQLQTGKAIVPSGAVTRARSAFAITAKLKKPPATLLSLVAKACATVGLFGDAHTLLRMIHKRLLEYRNSETRETWKSLKVLPTPDENELVLPDLHRALLRCSAKWGNVTAALTFCEDIQYLSRQLSWLETEEDALHSTQQSQNASHISALLLDPQRYATIEHPGSIGMKVPEWKSLLVAASKSGHWRVCLSALQFLRPYVEETHILNARDAKDRKRLHKNYKTLSAALTTAVKCLSEKCQYAWAVRLIDDWIHWSGRRPPRQAVLASGRLLSSRGRGDEVISLLTRSLSPQDGHLSRQDREADERMIYVGIITALYNDGHYDTADEVFIGAVSRGCLPFNLERQADPDGDSCMLDLHGMNVALAHSAVRVALQQEVLSRTWNASQPVETDFVIVTGRGRNSALQMRPVLRPEIQRMLVEEFYPPLSSTSIPKNMGALRVAAADINAWMEYQRLQKGARMLSVAATLKALTSGSRLQAALSRAAIALSPPENGTLDDD